MKIKHKVKKQVEPLATGRVVVVNYRSGSYFSHLPVYPWTVDVMWIDGSVSKDMPAKEGVKLFDCYSVSAS